MNQSLPHLLSASEFHDAVHQLSPAVAVFDCDGTLWSADAGSGFTAWTIETGLLSREAVDWIDARYRAYKRGEVSEVAICGEMVQVYQGLREDELRASAREFFRQRISHTVFPEMQRLVAALQQRGTTIWAVSSTSNWVIEEGVQRFQIAPERVLAARVEIQAGTVTDRLLDVPTDEGKVRALRNAGVHTPDAVFGNSVHDAAMLALARRPFAVNPSAALAEASAAEGWSVFFPADAQDPAEARTSDQRIVAGV